MVGDFIKRHRFKIASFLLILIPFILLASHRNIEIGKDKTSRFGRAAYISLGWSQVATLNIVAQIGQWAEGFFEHDVQQELEHLKKENARLTEERSRLIGVLQENMRLRQLVGFKDKHPELDLIAARVIAHDTTPYFRVIKIMIRAEDKNHGRLKPQMPVVVSNGVVGMIHKVYDDFAEVVLLSDPRSAVDVINQRNRAQGMVQGLGHERNYRAKVAYLSEKDIVRKGDTMVTSGMGGVFPQELIVGEVIDVQTHDNGLFQRVRLKPAVDFSRIKEVFVIASQSYNP